MIRLEGWIAVLEEREIIEGLSLFAGLKIKLD